MPAVIRVSGARSTLDRVAAESSLLFVESAQCQRERRQNPDTLHTDTTYNLTVSDADNVTQQIADADRYLITNEQALKAVFDAVPAGEWSIDLSWDFPRQSVAQYNLFPPPFLARLAELQMTLVVSVYGTEDEE